jgi:hypothetical protein
MLKPQNASREPNTRGATVLGMHTWGPRGEVSLACPGQIVIAWEFFLRLEGQFVITGICNVLA